MTGDVSVNQSFVGNPIEYNHTCSIFDTLCIDTIIGCQSNESPLFKKDGRWIRFSDDTIYELYQKMHIEFLPILLVPRANNSLTDVDLDRTCNVFPNPASDILNVTSQFKVKDIEIYNIIGMKIKEIAINNYEANIDISNFSSGNYIVKLITTRGIATKKLIIK